MTTARKSFHQAVVKNPTSSPEDLAGTMQTVQGMLAQTPNDPLLLYIYGRGKEAQGDKSSALEYYNQAKAINPLIDPDLAQGFARLGSA